MSPNKNEYVRGGVKLVASLLIAGGIIGILFTIAMAIRIVMQQPFFMVFAVLSILVYGWNALKGMDLWRGKPQGLKWAKIMLALQTPVICVPGFLYEFNSPLHLNIMVGHVGNAVMFDQIGATVEFAFGPNFNLHVFSPQLQCLFFSVNVVALIALVYLIKASWPNHPSTRTRGKHAPV